MPQHRYATVHVVGTNGKSSVALMTAALLGAHGVHAGAYLSPHIARWTERIVISGAELTARRFAAAVERAAEGAEAVDRTLDEGDALTQFEVLTAAAFVALAAARVEVAVIEAGLGGRLDATNVIPSRCCALTSVSLEHTDLLGGTEREIAAEKLAVLRDHSTLVVGRVSPDVRALAGEVAAERSSRVVDADPDPGPRLGPPGPYQRRNLAVARAAAEAIVGGIDDERALSVAAELELPGRLQHLDHDPPTVLDAAHNPEGAAALVEALPEIAPDRPVVACVAVLAEKDAAGIARALAPAVRHAVCTEVPARRLAGAGRPGSRSLPADELASVWRDAGVPSAEAVADPAAAVRAARDAARDRSGVALITGTNYLLGYAWTERHDPSSWR